jgi:hypothetical protein
MVPHEGIIQMLHSVSLGLARCAIQQNKIFNTKIKVLDNQAVTIKNSTRSELFLRLFISCFFVREE